MYVCTYACMFVCIQYVCMYVCVYVDIKWHTLTICLPYLSKHVCTNRNNQKHNLAKYTATHLEKTVHPGELCKLIRTLCELVETNSDTSALGNIIHFASFTIEWVGRASESHVLWMHMACSCGFAPALSSLPLSWCPKSQHMRSSLLASTEILRGIVLEIANMSRKSLDHCIYLWGQLWWSSMSVSATQSSLSCVCASGYSFELIVPKTVSYQWFHKPVKKPYECLKKVWGVMCEVRTPPGCKNGDSISNYRYIVQKNNTAPRKTNDEGNVRPVD